MWQAHEIMRRIGTVLRITNDDVTHEPLPERWVDLIHYLDEKERGAIHLNGREFEGATPAEAVARLWISSHK